MEVSKLKLLLGISEDNTEQDALLQFVLDDVKETIANYCNVKEVPEGLTNTAYRMAMDLYRSENLGSAEVSVMAMEIKTGDTSTAFANQTSLIKDTVLKDYKKQLNRYRKLVF